MRPARYRGRHRQPSNAARLTAIGAVGAGTLAASVIAPPLAHAATGAQWDRIAQCESGGNWHADTGNGFYGGLQFTESTWSGYGGGRYAARADEASRREQITIANRVLHGQGWGAWPVCSHYAGPATESAPVVETDQQSASARRHHVHHQATSGHHRRYVVRSGDTLVSIAKRHHVHGGWRALYDANRHAIGSNPDVIHVGMHLRIPR